MKKLKLKCDVCKRKIALKRNDDIKEESGTIDNVFLKITYFVCPHCGKVYIINVFDVTCIELLDDIKRLKESCKNAKANDNLKDFYIFASMLDKNMKRLESLHCYLKNKYKSFTFDKDKGLIYHK